MTKEYERWSVEPEIPADLTSDYINHSWERDKLLLQAIQTGNKDLLDRIKDNPVELRSNKHYYGNPNLPGNILRTRKNGLIIRNMICRVAAGLGGVPPLYLHYISEKYVLQIEQATSASYLIQELTYEMFHEYIDLVVNFSSSKYSKVIKDVVIYITEHIYEPLTLSTLAEEFHINASHLSRKFKQETGFTVSEYVNRQKIDVAKLLFSRGNQSVMSVAAELGFSSSSYFSKLFKKITGKAPIEYIQRLES